MTDPASYSPWLWLFTVLLAGRVLGQLLVWLRAPRWLPPMKQWESGLVRYPFLLATQTIVVLLMVWISIDFTRGSGAWVQPRPQLGRVVLIWSYLYFGAMILRYIIWMARRPDQRWLGGTIPIVFHSVVAAFQWTFAMFHVAAR